MSWPPWDQLRPSSWLVPEEGHNELVVAVLTSVADSTSLAKYAEVICASWESATRAETAAAFPKLEIVATAMAPTMRGRIEMAISSSISVKPPSARASCRFEVAARRPCARAWPDSHVPIASPTLKCHEP